MKNGRSLFPYTFWVVLGALSMFLLPGCDWFDDDQSNQFFDCGNSTFAMVYPQICMLFGGGGSSMYGAAQTAPTGAIENYNKLPLTFEFNEGQVDSRFQFIARGKGYNLFLSGAEAVLELRGNGPATGGRLRVTLAGANPYAQAHGLDPLPGTVNYFIGNDPKQWHTGIHTYARVQYHEVYPGVSVLYYGKQLELENDFVIAPGANAGAIRLAFEGAEEISIGSEGELMLRTRGGDLRWRKPVVYQYAKGGRSKVEGKYALKAKGVVGFELGPYDASRPLILDPVLTYSTYLGRQGNDAGMGIAVDPQGNVYVTGATSSNLPTTAGAVQTTPGSAPGPSAIAPTEAFVTKLNPTGTALIYSTYLGGNADDSGMGIAVDASGNAYVTGFTGSKNFPTTAGAYRTKLIGRGDVFVTKLNPAGNQLAYSTYLGGKGADIGWGIAIDSAGNAYVTGSTQSTDFPTSSVAIQANYAGGSANPLVPSGDAFVTKLNAAGSALVYSTYLGGVGDDRGMSIAVDTAGNAYITGSTTSTNFPTTVGALQTKNNGVGGQPFPDQNVTLGDAFIAKVNPSGSALVYSTFLGGNQDDAGLAIAIDGSGAAYVTGSTLSSNFPVTTGAYQTVFGGAGGQNLFKLGDAFVAKLNAAGNGLVYSTFLGGKLDDLGRGIAVDSAGNAYVTGTTLSLDFPVTKDAIQSKFGGTGNQFILAPGDAFVTKLNAAGSAALFSTYLGGEADDAGLGVALDAAGNLFVTGNTVSFTFPTTAGVFQKAFGGARGGKIFLQGDGFIARIGEASSVTVSISPLTATLGVGQSQQFTATVSNASNAAVTWSITPTTGSISATGVYTAPTVINAAQTVTVTATSVADPTRSASATVTLTAASTPTPAFSSSGVLNAASFLGGPVSPGLIVTFFGNNIGPGVLTGARLNGQGLVDTTVAETRILFDGVAAPLIYVSGGQSSAIVPYAVAGKTTTQVQVEYRGVRSAPVTVAVADAAPALFSANSSGKGPGAFFNQDMSVNAPTNPAEKESVVTLYGTGEGQTTPSGADGKLAADVLPKPRLPVSVTIGGQTADVQYAGAAPGLVAGVFQINVTVPAGIASGDAPVVVTIGSASSQIGLTLAVK